MRVVEEAFETLRSAGLGPDARSALAAILDHVMDDFDGDRRRWADRAKYQMLMERLAGGGTSRPIVIDGAPKLIMDDDQADLILADTDAFVKAELKGVGGPRRLLPEDAIAATPLIASLGLGTLEAMVHSAVATAVSQSLARPGSRDLLSSRVAAFLSKKQEELGQNAKHLADYPGRINVFIAIVGDKPIGNYRKDDMLRYRDILDQVPVNAKKRFRTEDLLEAIEKNEAMTLKVPLIDAKTVNSKYLSPIKSLFRYFIEQGIIERNPVDGVASKREKIEGVDIGGGEERLPLTADHIKAIGAIADRKPKDSPDRVWISILPRTGLRLDEFAQLTVFDIQRINGRPCIDLLHADVSDPDHLERRKILDLKTEASRRVIPIHPDLLEGGFLEFVERRRRRDGDMARLFPNCLPDRFGCHSGALSKRLNRQIDKVTEDPRHVVHSTRHTFSAVCDAAGVPEALKEKFMGHMGEDDESKAGNQRRSASKKLKRRYGSPIPSAEEMAWIDRLKF